MPEDYNSAAAFYLNRGNALQHAGRTGLAEHDFRAVLQIQPNNTEANHKLGILLIKAEKGNQGLPYLETALASSSSPCSYVMRCAEELIAANRANHALPILEAAKKQYGCRCDELDITQTKVLNARLMADDLRKGTIHTHCFYHLGDHLVFLHYLRKLAAHYPGLRFVHAASYSYLPQLIEIVSDVPNISLIDINNRSETSMDSWKNHDNYFYIHPLQNDYAAFFIEFFKYFSNRLGVQSPIESNSDLLFDYPGILKNRKINQDLDFLIINSAPMSNQLSDFHTEEFDDLIGQLLDIGYSVVTTAPSQHNAPCTQNMRLSVTGIGGISLSCKYIVGVSTGPSWPTFNIWNTKSVRLRILMLDQERVFISPNTEHAKTMADVIDILKQHGIL